MQIDAAVTNTPADQTAPAAQPKGQRRYDVDWLRTIAIGLLIIYHSTLAFQPWGALFDFPINAEPLEALWGPMSMLNVWRIPILFVVSGMGVAFAMRRRDAGELFKDRLLRILLPLGFGFLFINPWLAVFLLGYYDQQPIFWPNLGHLWFLANIFIYVLVLLPFVNLFRSNPDNAVVRAVRSVLRLPFGLGLYLFAIPMALEVLLTNPEDFSIYDLTIHVHGLLLGLICFVSGFLFIAAQEDFWPAVQRVRWIALGVGAALFALRAFTPQFVTAFESMSWMLAAIGFAATFLNRPSPALSYLSQAVYPVYIVHLPVQFGLSHLILPTALPAVVKLILLMGGTLSISIALYEVIRRINLIRPLFGLKRIPKPQPETAPA